MIEVAIGLFGLDMGASCNLTIAEFVVYQRAHVRRMKAQHERDVWQSWIMAAFMHAPTSYKNMLKIAMGKGNKKDLNDPDGGLALQRSLETIAGFESWYSTEQKKADGS